MLRPGRTNVTGPLRDLRQEDVELTTQTQRACGAGLVADRLGPFVQVLGLTHGNRVWVLAELDADFAKLFDDDQVQILALVHCG